MFIFPPEKILGLFISGIYNRLKSKSLSLLELKYKTKNKNEFQKKDLYMIHHLACSGGSLISKIIRDSFNCILLSEINPGYSFGSHSFTPTDLLSQFAYASNKSIRTFKKRIETYNRNIDFCFENVDKNQFIVIRDWSEGDFYSSKVVPHICSCKDWINSQKYNIYSIVSVRHPLESFISKTKNNWEIAEKKNSLEIYCRRYLDFLNHYEGSKIIYYENVCNNYELEVKRISELWGKEFKKIKSLSNKQISGDSGRSSLQISLRPSKNISKEISIQMNTSNSYIKLCKRLGYRADIKENSINFFN